MSSEIQSMFDAIAIRYDFLNHLLSFGRHKAWRKMGVALIPFSGSDPVVLDSCGGTGDFLYDLSQTRSIHKDSIVGDFSSEMLVQSQKKYPELKILQLDALETPFEDATFDIILNGFGMRNLDSTFAGLSENFRLLKPKGWFLTLEFFRPQNPFTWVFYKVLGPLSIPFIGSLFSGRKSAYSYLLKSIVDYYSVADYCDLGCQAGFKINQTRICFFGIAHLVLMQKPNNE
jgi:demethylmenaquinone methyltransferase/2-methoxy-6-polyprenyl-1,4-benzoquinol methylase